jgi:hypothetical protein
MGFNNNPVLDLTGAFVEELERVGVIHSVDDNTFLLVEQPDTVLSVWPSIGQAKRALASELIERLDGLKQRMVKPLFRTN